MTVKERTIKFIKHLGIPVRQFEREAKLSYGYVSNMRVSIQPNKLTNISKRFPQLNTGWLLTGEGEMLKGNSSTPEDTGLSALINEKERIISMLESQVKMLQTQIEIKDWQIKELLKQRAANGAKDTTSAMAG